LAAIPPTGPTVARGAGRRKGRENLRLPAELHALRVSLFTPCAPHAPQAAQAVSSGNAARGRVPI